MDTADVNFAFKSNVIGQNVGFTGFNIQLETKASVQKASYPTTSGKTTEGVSKTNKFFSKENISESLHAVLDAAGCVPAFGVVPDALNGIFYLAEGNKLAAGMSFLAALPYGDVIKGAKYGSKLGKEIVENGIEYAVKKGTKETGEELIETVAAKVSKGGKHSNGIYEKADYHGKTSNSVKNKAPNMGQEALDNSVPIGSNTTRRVGISDGEFVVFDETSEGIFHGHVRSWDELNNSMKAALRKAGMVNKKGKIQ